ncbi:MAG: HEAT repeat domain-containing protein, partial [Isosphaeraceae bacterium]
RDNTNDGGGWDIRLHHFSGMEHHGYPSLYQRFNDEAIQPLADYGGGSGCGGLFLAEPGFPDGDGNALYTADWGRSWIFRHHLTPKGATFTADQTEFLGVPRVTDLDVDGSSHLYVASWQGATFTYAGPNVGYILRLSPKGYTPDPLPDFAKAKPSELVGLLKSPSHRRRLEAQRSLLRLGLDDATTKSLTSLAADRSAPIECRIAAVFTLKQGLNERSTEILANLAKDDSIREYAIRALTDRADPLTKVPAEPIIAALKDKNPRVRRQGVESLARLGKTVHAPSLTLLLADPDPIVAHTTVKALIMLNAVDACLAVIDKADAPEAARVGALRVLQGLHEPKVVEALSQRLERETNPSRRQGLTAALCRLYFQDGPWKGDSWGTRPDTSGPYYQPEPWAGTKAIATTLNRTLHQANGPELAALLDNLNLHKIQLEGGLETVIDLAKKDASLVPAAIDQLARTETIPASALPILIQAAESNNSDDATRAKAVIALAKTNDDNAFQAIVKALTRIDPGGQDPRLAQQARSAFLNAPKLADHVELFERLTQPDAGKGSSWADAALLVLTGANKGSPEARELANRAIDAAWYQPKRRAQLLHAVALANHRKSADRVLAALTDPDPLVADAAKTTAETLKLDTRPKASQPTGPKIKELTPEAVIAAVVKSQGGNRELGEQLFTRLNCANCHTVKTDEPLRGPFLGTVAATYKRHELAEAVLVPSKSIAQGFATNLFALDDGRTLTGFVVREAADQVAIRDVDGNEIQIPVSSIDQRVRQEVSVMPTGLADDLTVPEFSALLDFIESLAKK